MCLLRCAELTGQSGYRNFAIVGSLRVGETAKVRVETWPASGRQKVVKGHDEVVTLPLGETRSGFVFFEAFF
jgi:hypothetical protein